MKIAISMLTISALFIVFVLNITSPSVIGPFGILIFFVSAYIFFMGLFYVLLFFLRQVAIRISTLPAKRVAIEAITGVKLYYYATVLALSPVIYIGMQSMGAVGAFEVILLVLFEIIACFFVHKRY